MAAEFMTATAAHGLDYSAYTNVGTDFDYRSIMLYSSDADAETDGHPTLEAIGRTDSTVYSGGSPRSSIASVSVLDSYRVAQLYPKDGVNPADILQWKDTGWPPIEVEVPGEPNPRTFKDSLQA